MESHYVDLSTEDVEDEMPKQTCQDSIIGTKLMNNMIRNQKTLEERMSLSPPKRSTINLDSQASDHLKYQTNMLSSRGGTPFSQQNLDQSNIDKQIHDISKELRQIEISIAAKRPKAVAEFLNSYRSSPKQQIKASHKRHMSQPPQQKELNYQQISKKDQVLIKREDLQQLIHARDQRSHSPLFESQNSSKEKGFRKGEIQYILQQFFSHISTRKSMINYNQIIYQGPLLKFHSRFNSNFVEYHCKLSFQSFMYSKHDSNFNLKTVNIHQILDLVSLDFKIGEMKEDQLFEIIVSNSNNSNPNDLYFQADNRCLWKDRRELQKLTHTRLIFAAQSSEETYLWINLMKSLQLYLQTADDDENDYN